MADSRILQSTNPDSMSIAALIFDMDGLMIDTERLYYDAQQRIAARHETSISRELLGRMMGRKPEEAAAMLVAACNLPLTPTQYLDTLFAMMLDLLKTDLQPMPGLEQVLARFRGRLPLAIATGSTQTIVDQVVCRLNLEQVFQVIQTSDSVSQGKPHPEIYLRTARRLGIAAERCAVLEDSANGVRAAAAAGCHVVAVPSEHTRDQDFTAAHHIALHLGAAADYLEGILAPGSTAPYT